MPKIIPRGTTLHYPTSKNPTCHLTYYKRSKPTNQVTSVDALCPWETKAVKDGLQVKIPIDAAIGLYSLSNKDGPERAPCQFMIIFNAADSRDPTYHPSLRDSYTSDETIGRPFAQGKSGWCLDVRDRATVEVVNVMLSLLPYESRSSPLLVIRHLLTCISNISGEVHQWTRGREVMAAYLDRLPPGCSDKLQPLGCSDKPAAAIISLITTSILRCIGIICAPVINYNAREIINADGDLDEKLADSVSLHYWNHIFTARDDLDAYRKPGWQVIGVIPQNCDKPGKVFGPCPISAIKDRKNTSYDMDFFLSETAFIKRTWSLRSDMELLYAQESKPRCMMMHASGKATLFDVSLLYNGVTDIKEIYPYSLTYRIIEGSLCLLVKCRKCIISAHALYLKEASEAGWDEKEMLDREVALLNLEEYQLCVKGGIFISVPIESMLDKVKGFKGDASPVVRIVIQSSASKADLLVYPTMLRVVMETMTVMVV